MSMRAIVSATASDSYAFVISSRPRNGPTGTSSKLITALTAKVASRGPKSCVDTASLKSSTCRSSNASRSSAATIGTLYEPLGARRVLRPYFGRRAPRELWHGSAQEGRIARGQDVLDRFVHVVGEAEQVEVACADLAFAEHGAPDPLDQ